MSSLAIIDALSNAELFSVMIGMTAVGSGDDSVLLVSAPLAASPQSENGPRPVVIEHAEFRALIDVLSRGGFELVPGAYVSDEPQCFANVTVDDEVYNAALGLDRATVDVLRQIQEALQPQRRPVLDPLIKRIEHVLGPVESPDS